jgi:hypothetical protein
VAGRLAVGGSRVAYRAEQAGGVAPLGCVDDACRPCSISAGAAWRVGRSPRGIWESIGRDLGLEGINWSSFKSQWIERGGPI